MSEPEIGIELTHVITRLTELRELAKKLDGVPYADGPGKSTANRILNQRMNYLADSLHLVSCLVRDEYWIGKGVLRELA